MGDWQPIATAPRDGTMILAWTPQGGVVHDGFMWLMRWDGIKGAWTPWALSVDPPTHWQPLPPPPSDATPQPPPASLPGEGEGR